MVMSDSEKRNLKLAKRQAFFAGFTKKPAPEPKKTKKAAPKPVKSLQPFRVSDPSALVRKNLLPTQLTQDQRFQRVMELRQLKVERFEENRRNNILNEKAEYFDPRAGRQRYLGGDK